MPSPGPSGLLAALERRTGTTPAGLAVAASVLPGLALGRALGSRPVFLLAYGAVAVLGLSRLLAHRRLSVQAHRSSLPTRVREGAAVDVELTVTAARRLATVVLEETLPPALASPVRIPVDLLEGGQSVRHGYGLTARQRGVYQVGPLVAEWTDPFGLTRRRTVLAAPQTILVHPSYEGIADRITSREWEDPPERPPLSRPWPSGFEFYGLRDYIPGDDPRRINWLASARTVSPDGEERYLVRESEQGITDRVRLVLDTDVAHHSPGDPSETFERAVRVVASLGVRHLADGFAVTLESNGARLAQALRGSRSRIPLLDRLAAVAPERASLSGCLDRLFLDRQRATHNVIVTPHLDEPTARRVSLLLARGTAVLLVLVMAEDTDPACLHRAALLGCGVVELPPGGSIARPFQRVVGAGAR